MGLPRTVSKIKSYDCNILTAHAFNSAEGVPLGIFLMAVELEKTRMMLLQDRQRRLTMLNNLETVRRMDRFTITKYTALCIHCMLTRNNNVKTATLP